MTLNEFKAADAFEYVDNYRKAVKESPSIIRAMLAKLDKRMSLMSDTPSYLLAAYRAYEDALGFAELRVAPTIVKLDQSR